MDGSDASAGFDYPALLRAALRKVVRDVLSQAAEQGLPGDHHFYLTFGTQDEGVLLTPRLHSQFPDEMTIVLQHQFWNLSVDQSGFSVTLRFGGKPERLTVPWTALRSFADPSVGFGLQLGPAAAQAGPGASPVQIAPAPAETDPGRPEVSENSKVVDLGAFRRRSD